MRKFIHKHPFTFAVSFLFIAGVGVDLVNNDLHSAIQCLIIGLACIGALYAFWEQ